MRLMMMVIPKGYESGRARCRSQRGSCGDDDGVQQGAAEAGNAARVPILAGMDSNRMNSLWVPFILINLGCSGRILLQVLTDFVPGVAFPLVGLTGFIEFTALLWWGVELWRTMNVAKTSRTKMLVAPLPLGVR
jgi:hypothetical protein